MAVVLDEKPGAPSTVGPANGSLTTRALYAGLLLGLTDLVVGALRGHSLFLRPAEWLRFIGAELLGSVALAAILWLIAGFARRVAVLFAPTRPERFLAGAGALIAGAVTTSMMVELTAGRTVRDHALRYPAVGLCALVAAAVVGGLTYRARAPLSRAYTIAFSLVSVGAIVTSAYVLPRLYPAFHWGLALVAVGAVLYASTPVTLPVSLGARAERQIDGIVRLACVPALALALFFGAEASNTSFAIRQSAPVLAELVGLVQRARGAAEDDPVVAAVEGERGASAAGISLGDTDVLLITVDALRADRLKAYGGSGVTPELDALAAEGAVFTRAYTPTPHTSYAVGSLLTSKYLRPIFELSAEPTDHPTTPELVRRYGSLTAAFFPPAVFYVESERFVRLSERGMGFEYQKAMFADADLRVRQLQDYLGEVSAERPVFAWVHLFEPHEPYEPPAAFQRGDSTEARYDGEVAYADHAIGELVRAFRARRPNGTVIVTADHGEELGEHGGQFHGTTVYDEQVRVPLIWSSPGVVAPAVIHAPVSIVDIGTTLLGALGIPRDARMRGTDLGPLLAGDLSTPPTHVYATVDGERMITDGRYKAICEDSGGCRLYDLVADPLERINVADSHTQELVGLRGALSGLIASIPSVEALAMAGGSGWPEALARAALGDPTAATDIAPLLGDPRAEVRVEAVRLLARMGEVSVLPTLARLSEGDPDAEVKAEAALARFALGDKSGGDSLRALVVAGQGDPARLRRVALALAQLRDAAGVELLAAWAEDTTASEAERVAAIDALATLEAKDAVPALIRVLEEVRLRPVAARALGLIGDRRAADPLAKVLAEERHLAGRQAEAEALVALNDPRATRLIVRFLGVEQPLPGGLALLDRLSALTRVGRRLGLEEPGFACTESGCAPGEGASLSPSEHKGRPGRDGQRLVVVVTGAPGAALYVGETRLVLAGGQQDLSLRWPEDTESLPLRAEGDAKLIAYAFVPVTPEVEPPAPEPWSPEDEADQEASSETASATAPAQ